MSGLFDVDMAGAISSDIVDLFKGFVVPEISLTKFGRVFIPDNLSVQVGGSRSIIKLLACPKVFNSKNIRIRKAILDILYIVLRKSSYNVMRFQCFEEMVSPDTAEQVTLIRLFLNLLHHNADGHEYYAVTKRIIRLFGVLMSCDIRPCDIKEILFQLQPQSDVNVCWLQAIKAAMKKETVFAKASPPQFFNFGGAKSGLFSVLRPFPFLKEYQVFTWFRIESFLDTRPDLVQKSAVSVSMQTSYQSSQSIVCFSTPEYTVDVCIENRAVTIKLLSAKGASDSTIVSLKASPDTGPLRRGVWYHICVKHTQSRYSSFFGGSDELVVNLDHKAVFSGPVKYPLCSKKALTEFSVGRNFDGQIGPVYFCSEIIPSNIVFVIAQIDAGKGNEADPSLGLGLQQVDMPGQVTVNPIKFLATYHPSRIACGHAMDIHSGMHARFGPNVFVSKVSYIRDILDSIGGVVCLFPLFPSLLIERDEETTYDDCRIPNDEKLGDMLQERTRTLVEATISNLDATIPKPYYYTLRDLLRDSICDEILDDHILKTIESTEVELEEENYLSLLLGILSRCIEGHSAFQEQLIRFGGIEMIEYVLLYNAEANAFEIDASCVRQISNLRAVVKDIPALELRITKHLLCNFNVWGRCSYEIQCMVESMILDDIRSRPDYYANNIGGVKWFLNALDRFYLDSEAIVKYDPSTAPNSCRTTRFRTVSDSIVADDQEIQEVKLSLPPKFFASKSDSTIEPKQSLSEGSINIQIATDNLDDIHSYYSSHGGTAGADEEDVSVFISDEPSLHGENIVPDVSLSSFLSPRAFPNVESKSPVAVQALMPATEYVDRVRSKDADERESKPVPPSHLPVALRKARSFFIENAASPSPVTNLTPSGLKLDTARSGSVPMSPGEEGRGSATPRGNLSARPRTKFKTAVRMMMQRTRSGEEGYDSNTDDGSVASDLSQTPKVSLAALHVLENLPETPRTALTTPRLRSLPVSDFASALTENNLVLKAKPYSVVVPPLPGISGYNTTPLPSFDPEILAETRVKQQMEVTGEIQSTARAAECCTARTVTFKGPESPMDSPARGSFEDSNSDKAPIFPMLSFTNSSHDLFLGCFTPRTARSSISEATPEPTVASFLTRSQREHLRLGLWAMMTIVIKSSDGGEDHLRSLLCYLIFCKDTTVLGELALIILRLVLEGSEKVFTTIVDEFCGPDEFASCVVLKLISHPAESIRLAGMRLLSLFLVRSATWMIGSGKQFAVLPRGKESKKLDGHQFDLCGGVSLLTVVLESYVESFTLRMYSSILELLLLKPEMLSNGFVQVPAVRFTSPTDMFGQSITTPISSSLDAISTPSTSTAHTFDFAFATCTVPDESLPVFMDQYLRHSQMNDEDEDPNMVNSFAVPLVFSLLPRLPTRVKHQAITDLLSLLKHSAGNRTAICQWQVWHCAMFALVAEFIEVNSHNDSNVSTTLGTSTENMSFDLNKYELLQNGADHPPEPQNSLQFASNSTDSIDKSPHFPSRLSVDISVAPQHRQEKSTTTATNGEDDMWFSVSIKIYTTMLQHEMQQQNGWLAVVTAVAQSWSGQTLTGIRSFVPEQSSYGSSCGSSPSSPVVSSALPSRESEEDGILPRDFLLSCTANSILSHFLSDSTFAVRKTYHELKSKKHVDKLANLLSVIIFTGSYALADQSVATSYLPCLPEIRRRKRLYAEMHGVSSDASKFGSLPPGSGRDGDLEIFNRVEELIALNYLAASCTSKIDESLQVNDKNNPSAIDFNRMFVDLSYSWKNLPVGINSNQQVESEFWIVFTEESLKTLDCKASRTEANLVMVLQNLRLFDALFWTEESLPFRNSNWLKFSKTGGLSVRNEASAKSATETTPYLNSVFVAILRQSLFVLANLHPMHELAVSNVFRLRNLLSAAKNPSDVPRKLLPMRVCVVTAFVHVVLSLQRLVAGLAPIFEMLGLVKREQQIKVAGRPSSEELRKLTHDFDEDCFIFDNVQPNSKAIESLNSLFGTIPGENLLRFIKGCLVAILTLVTEEWSFELLRSAYNVDAGAISDFVGRMNEIRPLSARDVTSRSFGSSLMLSHDGSELPLEHFTPVHTCEDKQTSIKTKVPESDMDSSASSSCNSVDCEDQIVTADDHFPNLVGTVSSLSVLGDADESEQSPKGPSHNSSKVVQSLSISNASDSASSRSPGKVPTLDFGGKSSLTFAGQFDALDGARTGDSLMSLDMISVLRILRDPFFRFFNCCLSEHAVLDILGFEEEECRETKNFNSDMIRAETTLIKSAESYSRLTPEAVELQHMSTNILIDLSIRDRSRLMPMQEVQEAHLRKSAQFWDECNHTFDTVWSPYYDPSLDAADQLSCTASELNRICDTRLRRMIMTKAYEAHDYSQAANVLSRSIINGDDDQETLRKDISKSGSKQKWLKSSLSSHTRSSASGWDLEEDEHLGDSSTVASSATGATNANSNSAQQASQAGVVALNSGRGQNGVVIEEKESRNNWLTGIDLSKLMPGMSGIEDKKPEWSSGLSWKADEKTVFHCEAILATLQAKVSVEVLITNRSLVIHRPEESSDHVWELDWLEEIYARRHLQKVRSAELCFVDSTEVLLIFGKPATLRKFFKSIRANAKFLRGQTSVNYRSDLVRPEILMRDSPWTERWSRRLISNYEYLMRLNLVAGRSFQDLSQYPIFPWILADYSSPNLDLTIPSTFRDLSKPMGALNEERLNYFLERYESFGEEDEDKFLYGSHYSTEGYVLYYLLRQEPFTTLGIQLQGGRFDCPDRLFIDVAKTWESCSALNPTDVKELIPEFFCCPEIFLNSNNLPLGTLQDSGRRVGHVLLPSWATTPYEFIRLHREALESDFVSAHLHEWIDLIFGFKQSGAAAVEANNLFRSLTYEDKVDVDEISDEKLRKAVEDEILYYGQTPSLLFSKPHPRRKPKEECVLPLCSEATIPALSNIKIYTPPKQLASLASHSPALSTTSVSTTSSTGISTGSAFPVISIQSCGDRLVVIHSDYKIVNYRWNLFTDSDGLPFQVKFEKERLLPSVSHAMSPDILAVHSFVPLAPATISSNSEIGINSKGRPMTRPIPHISPHATSVSTFSSGAFSAGSQTGAGPPMSAVKPPSRRKSQLYSSESIRLLSQTGQGNQISVDEEEIEVLLKLPSKTGETANLDNSAAFTQTSTSSTSSSSYPSQLSSSSQSTVLTSVVVGNTTDIVLPETAKPVKRLSIFESIKKGFNDSVSKIAQIQAQAALQEVPTGTQAVTPPTLPNSTSTGLVAARLMLSPKNVILDDHLFDAQSDLTSSIYDSSLSTPLEPYTHKNVALHIGVESSGRIVTCGYWDHSFRVHALESLKESISSGGYGHRGGIACLQLAKLSTGLLLITGGHDGTCRVWVIDNTRLAAAYANTNNGPETLPQAAKALAIDSDSSLKHVHTLLGHQSIVSAMHYCSELDLLFSGGSDGTLCLHSVRQGQYVRSILNFVGSAIDQVLISAAGYLVAYSEKSKQMQAYWVNGEPLAGVEVEDKVTCMAVNGCSTVLVTGDIIGQISLRGIWNLVPLRVLNHSLYGSVTCLWFTEDSQYLLIGSSDGHFSVATDPDMRGNVLLAAMQSLPLLGSTI